MIETPSIIQTTPQLTAIIPLTIPRHDIAKVMRPGIQELMGALIAQDIQPAGPWFSHHLRMVPDIFDFEISVPVTAPVKPVGRVKSGLLPAMKIARTIYHGEYEGLSEAWGELHRWIEANGHSPASNLWECYLIGPQASTNPADWRTELNQPIE